MTNYYKILDKNLIGKQVDRVFCYIYNQHDGWVLDNDHILMDRIIGYDIFERSIGNTDMMSRIEEISEEDAMKIINN